MATERSEGGSDVLDGNQDLFARAGEVWWVYTGVTEEHVVALLLSKFPGSFMVRQSEMRRWYDRSGSH